MGTPPTGRGDSPDPREPPPISAGKHAARQRAAGEPSIVGPYTEVEPGWKAARALLRLRTDALLAVMLRPSFRPAGDLDLVQVAPCPYCQDGGLRTAGSVRTRAGRAAVRACDTCAAVDIGGRPLPRSRRS